MDERSEPAHVEVELTSRAIPSRRGWGRRRDRDAAPASADAVPPERGRPVAAGPGTEPDVPSTDTVVRTESLVAPEARSPRRAVVVGVGAGVAGLTLGWLLGGASGSTEQATTASAPTSVPTDDEASAEATDDALAPIETVRPTPTTRARPTPTTRAFPAAETTEVALNPKLAGAAFRIVGVAGSSGTATIDVASGTMTRQDWLVGSIEPFGAVVGDGWFAASNPSSGNVQVFTPDGRQTSPDIGDPWSLLWVEGTDLFWRPTNEPFAAGVGGYELVDLSGDPTGPTIDGRGTWPAGVDPAGGVLTVGQGKTYSLREAGVEFVGSGELVAISADHAALRSCDEQLECGLFVLDRATGERREVPVDPGIVRGTQFFFGPQTGAVAPDGGALSFFAPTDRGIRLLVVDLGTGAVHELAADIGGPAGLSWSPDGRFGVFLLGTRPQLFVRETGEVEPLGDDLGSWRTVEIRPPRVSVAEEPLDRGDVEPTTPSPSTTP